MALRRGVYNVYIPLLRLKHFKSGKIYTPVFRPNINIMNTSNEQTSSIIFIIQNIEGKKMHEKHRYEKTFKS